MKPISLFCLLLLCFSVVWGQVDANGGHQEWVILEGPAKYWVPLGEDINGNTVTYRRFNKNTRCDDCSEILDLPFSFKLYDQDYSQVSLNANGNLTFGESLEQFTPDPFCMIGYRMAAPFFSDVDIQKCGWIDYYIDEHSLIVTWSEVCHYRELTDSASGLVNTFQLVLTDGIPAAIKDTLLPLDATLVFSYGDMQWTTGKASKGEGGFGGTAATVGINEGDGIACFNYGIFDHDGYDFDRTDSIATQGVSHLDYRSLLFDGQTGRLSVSDSLRNPSIEVGPEPATRMDFRLYPNPTTDRVFIDFKSNESTSAIFRITDMKGQRLTEFSSTAKMGRNSQMVDLSGLPQGIYLVSISYANQRVCRQVVKL